MKYIHEVDALMDELTSRMLGYLIQAKVQTVQVAYQQAKHTYANQRNEFGELYLGEQLKVLEKLVYLHLDEFTLANALTPTSPIREQLDTITHLIDTLKDAPSPSQSLLNQLLETRNDTSAYFILFAKQLVNPQPSLIESYYLPMARQLHANYFISEFEEYLFAHANKEVYQKLCQQYQQERDLQARHILQFEKNFNQELITLTSRMHEIYYTVASSITKIYYVKIPYQSQEIPLVNYIFQLPENTQAPIQYFFKIYIETLHPQGYLWLGQGQEEENLRHYVLLQDRYHNTYRLFLMTQKQIHTYQLGLNQQDHLNTDGLTVYDLEGHPFYLPSESTILDYAFQINEKLACHLYAFTLNHQYYHLQDIIDHHQEDLLCLHQGDRIQLYHDLSTPTAQIHWFKWVHTNHAQNALITYFQPKIKEQ